jgi:hypothetical protein
MSTVSDESPLTKICLQSLTHSDFVATKSNLTFTIKTGLFVKTHFFPGMTLLRHVINKGLHDFGQANI